MGHISRWWRPLVFYDSTRRGGARGRKMKSPACRQRICQYDNDYVALWRPRSTNNSVDQRHSHNGLENDLEWCTSVSAGSGHLLGASPPARYGRSNRSEHLIIFNDM